MNVMKNNRPAYGQVLIRFLPDSDTILTAFQSIQRFVQKIGIQNDFTAIRILNLGIDDPDTTGRRGLDLPVNSS